MTNHSISCQPTSTTDTPDPIFLPLHLIPRISSSSNAHLSMDDEKRHDDWASSRANRLPSFTEVLSRRTRPPVDLFMF